MRMFQPSVDSAWVRSPSGCRLNTTQWGSKCKDSGSMEACKIASMQAFHGGRLRSDGNGRTERCYKATGCRIIYELCKCARGGDIQHVAVMGPFGQFEDHLLVSCLYIYMQWNFLNNEPTSTRNSTCYVLKCFSFQCTRHVLLVGTDFTRSPYLYESAY